MVVYRQPACAYLEFLFESSDFLSGLLLISDKVVTVGDFNIHMDVNSLKSAFISLLESMSISQKVNELHRFNHTLDLILTNSVEPDHLLVTPLNPLLSYPI